MASIRELMETSDEGLRKIISNYHDQLKVVENDKKMIHDLEQLPKRTKKQEADLIKYRDVLLLDEEDLSTWETDARNAQEILEERKPRKATISTHPPTQYGTFDMHDLPESKKYKAKTETVPEATQKQRTIYINLIKKNLKGLSEQEKQKAITTIQNTWGKPHMKETYFYYKMLSAQHKPNLPHATEITPEEAQVLKPTQQEISNFQQYITYNIYQQPKQEEPTTLPKPPKHVSKTTETIGTNTAQTQTLVPMNAFKITKKGEQEFLEPLTPQKAEELAVKKKIVKNVVLLDPNRYKRKPYVIRSR